MSVTATATITTTTETLSTLRTTPSPAPAPAPAQGPAPVPATSTSEGPTFHLFNWLPLELRIQIYHAALRLSCSSLERLLILDGSKPGPEIILPSPRADRGKTRSAAATGSGKRRDQPLLQNHPLLSVSRESRREALRFFPVRCTVYRIPSPQLLPQKSRPRATTTAAAVAAADIPRTWYRSAVPESKIRLPRPIFRVDQRTNWECPTTGKSPSTPPPREQQQQQEKEGEEEEEEEGGGWYYSNHDEDPAPGTASGGTDRTTLLHQQLRFYPGSACRTLGTLYISPDRDIHVRGLSRAVFDDDDDDDDNDDNDVVDGGAAQDRHPATIERFLRLYRGGQGHDQLRRLAPVGSYHDDDSRASVVHHGVWNMHRIQLVQSQEP